MSIKLFFHISKDFFDQMYSQGIEENQVVSEQFDEETPFEEFTEHNNQGFCVKLLSLLSK